MLKEPLHAQSTLLRNHQAIDTTPYAVESIQGFITREPRLHGWSVEGGGEAEV